MFFFREPDIFLTNAPKSGPDILSIEKRRALLAELATSASYCKVAENVWIGDIGAAASAATGLVTTFRAVFNASGRESKGLSLAREYAARKISYASMKDDATGMTLSDSPESLTPDSVANSMVEQHDIEPSVSIFAPGWAAERVHSVQTATDAAFVYFMHEANRKIGELAKSVAPADGQILVHCYAGVNRSASAIVAYLVLSRGWKYDDAVSAIVDAVRVKRRMAALTNRRFRTLLATKILPGGAGAAEKIYAREHEYILSTANRIAKSKSVEKGTKREKAIGADFDSARLVFSAGDDDNVMREIEEAIRLSGRRGRACVRCGSADVRQLYMCAGPAKCIRNCGAMYCSRRCQILDFIFGNHAAVCGSEATKICGHF